MITGDNLTGSGITAVNQEPKNILITNNIISSILLPGGGNLHHFLMESYVGVIHLLESIHQLI